MKWTEKEIEIAISSLEKGLSYVEIGGLINRKPNAVRIKLNKLGRGTSENFYEDIFCKNCAKEFKAKKSDARKFCSQSCSASFNNKGLVRNGVKKPTVKCKNCETPIGKNSKSYCSQECHKKYEYNQRVTKWKSGEISGTIKCGAANFVKRYIREKFENKCTVCGWNEVNPNTGKIPLEIHHIDGDYTNNSEDNLDLLCPNHHALTENYKGANKGNGRAYRKKNHLNG